MSKLDAAQALAKRGFPVFPVREGAKAPPLVKDWPGTATTDAAEIDKLWAKWPNANIGIHCAGMVVVDVDIKKGGDASLMRLHALLGVPPTLTTRTPTGGRHLFYRLPEGHPGAPNTVETLGPGLDVRSNQGYVVAPGSEVEAGRYKFEGDVEVAAAPEWLVHNVGVFTKREQRDKMDIPDCSPDQLERAEAWLFSAERSVKGEGGDQAAYRVACRLRDLGASESQAIQLMSGDAWDQGCGWNLHKLANKPIRSAYTYASGEPGARSAVASDFPAPEDHGGAPPRSRAERPATHVPVRLSEFASGARTGLGYLVKGVINKGSYAEMYGAPGAGKTFVALDLAYHVAAGKTWMDHRVREGTVLYLAYEGCGGLVKRAQALRRRFGDADVPLYIVNASFNLRDLEGRQALGETIASLPDKPVLIIIDTFARALSGGDENSAQDVGAFNAGVAALIEATGSCVCIIHHSGKNKANGARGSSALLGAIDTEIEVDDHTIYATKQRDVEQGAPMGFALVPVTVGQDEDGDELTSCVVESKAISKEEKQTRLTGNAKLAFQLLTDLRPTNEPITDEEFRAACNEFLPESKEASRKQYWALKGKLKERHLIVIDEEGFITRRIA